MKNLLVAALLFMAGSTYAQTSFGVKGGLNYGATGEYEEFSQVVGDLGTIENGKDRAGYHFGVFGNVGFLGLFLQPELVYTSLTTEYNNFDYKLNKIDAPILLGINILGPLNIKAGPSFQYVMKNELEGIDRDISDVEEEITMGFQAGAGLKLGRVGFDLRYEGGFKENNAIGEMATDNNIRIDSRTSQWILSLAYSF